MKKINLPIVLALVGVVFMLGLSTPALLPGQTVIPATTSELTRHTQVCVYQQDYQPDGTYKTIELGCQKNLVTAGGLDHMEHLLGVGNLSYNATNFSYMALGNTSAPVNTSTTHPGEITNCGLARAAATYYSNAESDGNWTYSHTWTRSCDANTGTIVNTTGLLNASASGLYFSGTTFTAANLTDSDQLTVNYTQWVTSS